jgi:ParB family chromosome partitioning protein
VESGALSEGHARALLSLDSADDVSAMAARAAREGWSVRQTEVAARGKPARRTERQASSASAPDPNVADAVRRLEAALGTRVEIRRGGKSHQLVVYFYSDEELNALFERLTTG